MWEVSQAVTCIELFSACLLISKQFPCINIVSNQAVKPFIPAYQRGKKGEWRNLPGCNLSESIKEIYQVKVIHFSLVPSPFSPKTILSLTSPTVKNACLLWLPQYEIPPPETCHKTSQTTSTRPTSIRHLTCKFTHCFFYPKAKFAHLFLVLWFEIRDDLL